MIDLKWIKRKKKLYIQYSDVPFGIRPIPHCLDFSISDPDVNMEYSFDSEQSEMAVIAWDDEYKPNDDDKPWHNQDNKLIRDLNNV